MVATPCLSKVDLLFHTSCVGLQHDEKDMVQFTVCEGSLVYDSRNKLTKLAIDGGFDYVLWVDSDMVFKPDLLMRMLAVTEEHDFDFLSALCFRRKPPYKPVIIRQLSVVDFIPHAEPYEPYPEDDFFEIEASGFGCVLTTTKILKAIQDKDFLPFSPLPGWGEDYSFCIRARDLGYKLYCHSGIKVGHISQMIIDEDIYKEAIKNAVLDNNTGA